MEQIPPDVRRRVFAELAAIESSENVRVILAVESGSRAWGFESQDSDYDVRFIYVREPDWYLSINVEHKRDVIELPIENDLDINGWDIRKALGLLRKSNPQLFEWFGSPITYWEHNKSTAPIREILPGYYSPAATFYHYLHMARGNVREYLTGDVVWRKKYFYVLRPLLATKWISRGLGLVPTEFEKLVDAVLEPELRPVVAKLVEDKRAGREMDRGPSIPELSAYIELWIERMERMDHGVGSALGADLSILDGVFRQVLQTVWRKS